MDTLTIQIWGRGQWEDACFLTIANPIVGSSGASELEYLTNYGIEHHGLSDKRACSINCPVMFSGSYSRATWFTFIDDIMPAGAARRFWIQNLGLSREPIGVQDYYLLKKGTIAPIGNLRIKEAIPLLDSGEKIPINYFDIEEVLKKSSDFLSHANELGAVGGGATGAGGEAPKFLVRLTANNKVWIDAYQDDSTNIDQHYLVKFARNNGSDLDKDILRAEYGYYRFLNSIGIKTINSEKMMLHETNGTPSLWLPRFDVSIVDGEVVHHGMESVYSLLEVAPGTHLGHLGVMKKLITIFSSADMVEEYGSFNAQEFVNEWVKRDFLNVVLGNSDNHGRNTSFLKSEGKIEMCPIYDCAPMKADPEGIIRLIKWENLEVGGDYDWYMIAASCENFLQEIAGVKAAPIIENLHDVALKLTDIRKKLKVEGVPESILDFPSIGFKFVDQKLNTWGLL